MRKIELGKTGLMVSRVAIGTGTAGWGGGSNQTRKLGLEGLASLLQVAYDLGVTFWDTADAYGSHAHVRAALRHVDRDAVVITNKTSARSAADAERSAERYLRELGTDRLDIVLLHCMMTPDWASDHLGAMEALDRLKGKGLVRAVGVSCHHYGALEAAAAHPWVDVLLARINHAGVAMDAPVSRVLPALERAHARGKGLYGMKVLGQGRLKADVRGAFRYALGLDCVDAIVVGVESERELREDVDLAEALDPVRV